MSDLTPFKLPGIASYPGGKGADGTAQRLINEIPPHECYVEPFLGGGAIMRMKRPADFNLGMDLSDQVIAAWRDAPVWVKVRQQDGLQYLREIAHPDPEQWGMERGIDFIFIDPPYLDETLKTGRAPYAHRMPYAEHVRMLSYIQRIQCDIMVCALPNVLYENQLATWRTFQYQNKTRRGMQTEQVWMNYPKPERLHDTRYLGDTFRDRERIKRRAHSFRKQLAALPPLERQAILDRVNHGN